MILKNKLTHETEEIEYSTFKKKHEKDIRTAFESYRLTQLNKYPYKFQDDISIENDFNFNLQWNFNHFGASNWYIEKM